MPQFRVNLRFNQQNLGSAVNTYCIRLVTGTPPDAAILDEMTDWMEEIYASLRPYMDAGCVFASGQVLEVNDANETIRVVGSITPTVSGTATGDQLALTTAASAFVRTQEPKIRGSKRFPGIAEAVQVDGLFLNPLMTALTTAVIAWAASRGSILSYSWQPGVMSTVLEDFIDFAGSAVITNIPGTQVTRKPLRGQ